jgi:hypothetical protein
MSHPSGPDPTAPEAPHPAFNAMLICDNAIREEGTGKVSLIGIFEKIRAGAFPVGHPSLSVYVKVTDAQGNYQLVLELVRVQDLTVIGRGEAAVSVETRLEAAEWIFNLSWLVFEKPGPYEFRLRANGRHVGSKTFEVLDLGPGPKETEIAHG